MNQKKYLSVQDHLVSQEKFDLLYNEEFDFLETHPKPSLSELGKYYNSDEYISHTDSKKGAMASLYNFVKKLSLHQKVKLITRENNGSGKILDVGAGTADFLVAAKRSGWEIAGIEPNFLARQNASEKGVNLVEDLQDVKGVFDVITLWHVLEHIPNLEETVNQLTTLLKPHGTLIVAVPNYKSYDSRYYGEYWAAYDAPRHLYHFSKVSIEKLFEANFKLEKILPMWFDSFYVSLLSEKYKSKNKFSLKAIYIGLKSNLNGIFTKEYSSHIYCLRKN